MENTTSTFDRSCHAQELNDAYSSVINFKKTQNETIRRNLISAKTNIDHCLLKPHELFAGYTIDKPTPCKRLPNMPRELEQYTSAESTHFVGRSFNKVIAMINDNEWEQLFNFSYNS
jgi:hypothetical protein